MVTEKIYSKTWCWLCCAAVWEGVGCGCSKPLARSSSFVRSTSRNLMPSTCPPRWGPEMAWVACWARLRLRSGSPSESACLSMPWHAPNFVLLFDVSWSPIGRPHGEAGFRMRGLLGVGADLGCRLLVTPKWISSGAGLRVSTWSTRLSHFDGPDDPPSARAWRNAFSPHGGLIRTSTRSKLASTVPVSGHFM